jgi:3-phosphoshikimate 1-carboxyvinyltransferase
LLLGSIAHGRTAIAGLPDGHDVASTVACLRRFGVPIQASDGSVLIRGEGIEAWRPPDGPVDCGNSGTTMRILSGLAARCPFRTVLDGDDSLRRRPMERVARPLGTLGARIDTTNGCPPITIQGGTLRGAEISLEVPSGQVKSAVLLAGLGADGPTTVVETHPARDDTERMLAALGAPIRLDEEGGIHRVRVEAFDPPPFAVDVPGDPSSAAFLLTAAVLRGRVVLERVCLNPTRTGFLEVVQRMGGDLGGDAIETRLGEPVGWLEAQRSTLRSIEIRGPVPALVDELPLVAVLATQAVGTTVVGGAEELRVKESDRIAAVVQGLDRMGASIEEREDGFVVEGPTPLHGAHVSSWGDHRIAMALAVAALAAEGETHIDGFDAAAVTWPGFADTLRGLGAHVQETS